VKAECVETCGGGVSSPAGENLGGEKLAQLDGAS
jgi:hypothetical protein